MIKTLDSFLNRFSMYSVVSVSLLILLIVTMVMGGLGVIAQDPWAILASMVTMVAGVYAVSLVGAWITKSPLHGESSFITGGILAFIMTPTLDPQGLLALLAVGVLAGLSKFVLTWRGRHIFNPAAAGAFIATIVGFAFASWWVATPPLLLFTLIPAFLILYKTRRLDMALVFLLVSVPMLLATFLQFGVSLGDSIALLASWPLLFFVGFMLSEPLTMASRRIHQYVEAALVGFLFALPFSIGELQMTPLLALLIGNLYAFIVSRRGAIRLTFAGRHQLTPTSQELVFKSDKTVAYLPGQYMELTLPHPRKDRRGIRRMFSITSVKDDEIRFGVRFYDPSSTFKKALGSLKKGSRLTATSVNGDFVMPTNTETPMLLVAGGIGITPFISFLRSTRDHNDTILVYAVNSVAEIAYVDVLQKSGIPVIIVTADTVKLPVASWKRVTQPYLNDAVLPELPDDLSTYIAYISGPPPFVSASKKLLRLRAGLVKTDYFTGY